MDDEKDLDEVICEALLVAQKRFNETVGEYGFDPAYCDIRFTAWVKDSSLTERLGRFEIEHECKSGEVD